MTFYSLGDMASHFALRRQNVRMNTALTQLSQEIVSGQTADIARHLKDNYSYLGDIERNLRVLEGYDSAAKEASVFTGAMQAALEKVQQTSTALSADLIIAGSANLPQAVQTASGNAKGALSAQLSALNTNVAGRSLFSGMATDTAPFATSEEILAQLKLAVAGEVTLDGILDAVDIWFDTPGGGFETVGYRGASTDLSPFLVGEGETVELSLRGDNTAIRDILKNTAIAALASDPDLGVSSTLQRAMLMASGEDLLTSQGALTAVRADLGYAESRLDESKVRVSAERASFEMSRNELLGVDPYETATRLEAVQFQLENLYTVTARLSQLSLVRYL